MQAEGSDERSGSCDDPIGKDRCDSTGTRTINDAEWVCILHWPGTGIAARSRARFAGAFVVAGIAL